MSGKEYPDYPEIRYKGFIFCKGKKWTIEEMDEIIRQDQEMQRALLHI